MNVEDKIIPNADSRTCMSLNLGISINSQLPHIQPTAYNRAPLSAAAMTTLNFRPN